MDLLLKKVVYVAQGGVMCKIPNIAMVGQSVN